MLFRSEVSYLEGAKWLRFNGREQPCDPTADSYAQVLAAAYRWAHTVDRPSLMNGLYPNPAFARLTYQLSAALWRSCRSGEVKLRSLDALTGFDAGFTG